MLIINILNLVDCGIPIPPINGSIISYNGTKVGNSVTFKCDEGYRPSAVISGTCRLDSMWDPIPERHNCTFIYGL